MVFCKSRTDLKRHCRKSSVFILFYFFPIHPYSLLWNLATHATFTRQGSIIQIQLVECRKNVCNLIFHLYKLDCRAAVKGTCCSAQCQTVILQILLYIPRAIMKWNTSCWSHEYGQKIPRPTQDFQLVCISSMFFSVDERQQRLKKKYSFSNGKAIGDDQVHIVSAIQEHILSRMETYPQGLLYFNSYKH